MALTSRYNGFLVRRMVCCLSTMLVQLIMAEGSVLCGAGVFLLRGQGEDFSGDHLAEKEREKERDRGAALPARVGITNLIFVVSERETRDAEVESSRSTVGGL